MPSQHRGLTVTALALGWASSVQSFASLQHDVGGSRLTGGRTQWRLPNSQTITCASSSPENDVVKTVAQEWDADLYQRSHDFVWKLGSSLLDLVDLKPGERVLDIGCGTGELTEQLFRKASGEARIWGMDADPNMIQRAQEQFGDSNDGDLRFFVADVCDFHLDETVDVAFSNAALHWVGQRGASKAVEGISRALKENGRFVLEFGGKGNVGTIVDAVLRVMRLTREAADFWWYPSIGELSSIMEQHGLEVTHAQLFERPTELTGEDGLKVWLKMFANKFFEGRSAEEVDGIINRTVEEVRPILYSDGVWTADYRRIRVIGKKIPLRE